MNAPRRKHVESEGIREFYVLIASSNIDLLFCGVTEYELADF